MKCTNCGNEIVNEKAKLCPNCGTIVKTKDLIIKSSWIQQREALRNSMQKNNILFSIRNKYVIAIISLIAVIIAVYIGYNKF